MAIESYNGLIEVLELYLPSEVLQEVEEYIDEIETITYNAGYLQGYISGEKSGHQ